MSARVVVPGAEASLTDILCTRCGLCCDGSLFADVELTGPAEAARLETMGLEVEDDGAKGLVLSQPCAALEGRRCRVYAHRPKCCRAFECRLLQDVRRGAIGVEAAGAHIAEALTQIQTVKALVVRLGHRDSRLPLKERAAEVLAESDETQPGAGQDREWLAAAVAAMEKTIRTRFL